MPRAVYDAQAAYNLLGGLGESAKINLNAEEARIRRHYDALGDGRWPALALQVIHAPVFHGHAFSIAVELERALDISALEEALSGDHVTWCWRTRIHRRIWRRRDRTTCWCDCGRRRRAIGIPTRRRGCGFGRVGQSASECAECGGVRAGSATVEAGGDGAVRLLESGLRAVSG